MGRPCDELATTRAWLCAPINIHAIIGDIRQIRKKINRMRPSPRYVEGYIIITWIGIGVIYRKAECAKCIGISCTCNDKWRL